MYKLGGGLGGHLFGSSMRKSKTTCYQAYEQ